MMLNYLFGADLDKFPKLRHTMLLDRKRQFVDRLQWGLKTTAENYEIDEYDKKDALYIVCSDENGHHKGSMRLLPSDGGTMIGDHFSHVIPGITFQSSLVWECTRFCVSPNSGTKVATTLLAGAAKVMHKRNLRAFLGSFDAGMERAFSRFGSPPFILGSEHSPSGRINVGLWKFDKKVYRSLVDASLHCNEEYDQIYSRSRLANLPARTREMAVV